MSPKEFAEAVGDACSSVNGTIDGIENTLSTPDYESNFGASKLRADFDGITEAREIRLSHSCEDYVEMLYKVYFLHYRRNDSYSFTIQVDSTKLGWLPRPAPLSRESCPTAWDVFKDKNPGAGIVLHEDHIYTMYFMVLRLLLC
jgi:hypothetical protein